MKKLLMLILLLLTIGFVGRTQTVSFGTNYISNSLTHVPVLFCDFDTIGALLLACTYDTSLFTYVGYVNVEP